MSDLRIDLLEQKISVLQKDVESFGPAVGKLAEIIEQWTIRMNEIQEAQAHLEDAFLNLAKKHTTVQRTEDGKEL